MIFQPKFAKIEIFRKKFSNFGDFLKICRISQIIEKFQNVFFNFLNFCKFSKKNSKLPPSHTEPINKYSRPYSSFSSSSTGCWSDSEVELMMGLVLGERLRQDLLNLGDSRRGTRIVESGRFGVLRHIRHAVRLVDHDKAQHMDVLSNPANVINCALQLQKSENGKKKQLFSISYLKISLLAAKRHSFSLHH